MKDKTKFMHFSYGNINALVCISLVCWITFTIMGVSPDDITLVRGVSLIACLPALIFWEKKQKDDGGTNTFKEQFTDVFYGFAPAIYLVYFIPLAFI